MLALFVAVTILENLETLYATVYMLNENPVFRQIAVELLLQIRQRMLLGCFERRQRERMDITNALITFIAYQKNVCQQVNSAASEYFQVVNRAFLLVNADDFTRLTVDYDLVFDGMALLLA